ncbi:acetyl-CoA synthetase-like protein [Trametes meyenii]|nr:acetyl-CoA synthetase-like protein [Trametes meyenii]
MAYHTHLTVLDNSASLFSSLPAFKIPRVESDGLHVKEWVTVTYREFFQDVEQFAKYWNRTLLEHQIAIRSVVGIWLSGMTYLDALHIYGIARAGYIPQLFSLKLPNPELVYELLGRAGAQALVFDPSFGSAVTDSCPVPAEVAVDIRMVDVGDVALPSLWVPSKGDDVLMIYHTSGSTSGSPKLVPCTAEWMKSAVSKAAHITSPEDTSRRDVVLWLGSMCHTPQPFMLTGYLQHGACTVQPTKLAFTPEDLKDMVARCGLTHLNLYATFLTRHLHASRDDPALLSVLRQLDKIFYSGLSLAADDEAYACEQGIPIRNLFASTEIGAMLLSVGGRGADASYLEPIQGTAYGFFQITPSAQVRSETGYEDAHQRLLELVVLSSSGDCPHPSLRASDGHFHTGDLFLEVAPGRYISRGRDDDWIKSENALRCDTKAIEDNVRAMCGALIAECVVVGNGRPSPTLFVEPKLPGGDAEQLKREIIRRTRHFMARRYLQERILSTDFIVVVRGGALPRTNTKGNVRRQAVEQEFKAELDRIYGDN